MCSWTGREKFQVNTNGELLLRKIESDEGGCAAGGFSERGKRSRSVESSRDTQNYGENDGNRVTKDHQSEIVVQRILKNGIIHLYLRIGVD